MSRSKKIFAAFALVFFILLMYVVYDISSRTTFPGSGRSESNHPEKRFPPESDSAKTDTLQ